MFCLYGFRLSLRGIHVPAYISSISDSNSFECDSEVISFPSINSTLDSFYWKKIECFETLNAVGL